MSKQPKLLNLTQDFSFKRFFSTNDQVLTSFLKCFLPIADKISDVVILNPEDKDKENERTSAKQSKTSDIASVQPTNTLHLEPTSILPDTTDKKHIVLDLNIKLGSGENINVEMQATFRKYFLKRILFYWTKLYNQDLKKAEDYAWIEPTYSLIFTTFSLWSKEPNDIVNSFSIRSDKPPHNRLSEDLCIVIAELNKLPKDYKHLLDLREKWCYFLIHSSTLTEAECQYLSQNEELKMAIEHLKKLSEDERLHQEALSREKSLMAWHLDRRGLLEEGEAKGRTEGKAEGKAEERLEIARQMLKKGFSLSAISELTSLSDADINRLKK